MVFSMKMYEQMDFSNKKILFPEAQRFGVKEWFRDLIVWLSVILFAVFMVSLGTWGIVGGPDSKTNEQIIVGFILGCVSIGVGLYFPVTVLGNFTQIVITGRRSGPRFCVVEEGLIIRTRNSTWYTIDFDEMDVICLTNWGTDDDIPPCFHKLVVAYQNETVFTHDFGMDGFAKKVLEQARLFLKNKNIKVEFKRD